MNATAPQAYRESAVLTAPPERLVLMLYDGAIRFLRMAAQGIRDGDVPYTHDRLGRAEAIIDELLHTLDHERGGEVAPRLEAIYVFCKRHLMEARIERDAAKVEQVVDLIGGLREAWAQLCVQRATAAAAAADGGPRPSVRLAG